MGGEIEREIERNREKINPKEKRIRMQGSTYTNGGIGMGVERNIERNIEKITAWVERNKEIERK